MKKILSMLLVLAALLAMAATSALAAEIALVTDVGTIDDESFNQACWQGVEAYAAANNLSYQYYQPAADSTDERLASIDQAVSDGAKIIVCPGYLFGETVATAQELYPDTKFIAVDVSEGDLGGVPAQENLYCAIFGEEQAGYIAGYATVKDGYTKLGFLGGMAVPAVQRYGYGFVQG
ncbi:MAG: BMP family ABC transporter substrate-binding protein, partial [Clostridia bacterium]|nr:BMP family ABC transporter substrate-binding protein [Clostridia bacterium]